MAGILSRTCWDVVLPLPSENLSLPQRREERRAGNPDWLKKHFRRGSRIRKERNRKGKGFYILPSELFENVRRNAKNDPNLNETLSRVFKNIEDSAKGAPSEKNFKGLFDDIDVNSNKLGSTVLKRNEKLVKIMDAIGDLQLGNYQDNSIDAFGDAYEYLMTMYASTAGKSGGEFFTPRKFRTPAQIAGGKTEVNKVYDPPVDQVPCSNLPKY